MRRILGRGPSDDISQLGVDGRHHEAQVREALQDGAVHYFGQIAAAQQVLAGEHETDRSAQGVDVAGGRGVAGAAPQFGRHVLRRAQERVFLGHDGHAAAGGLGDAQIGQLHVAAARQENVRRLDVAMRHAVAMRLAQSAGGVHGDGGRFPAAEPLAAANPTFDGFAVDIFHH